MILDDALKRFILAKEALNLSDKTLRTYKSCINGFITYVKAKGFNSISGGCTEDKYYLYLTYLLEEKKIADISVASNARSIKTWFYWMMENKMIEHFHLSIPKYQERIPETFSDEELQKLLEQPNNKCSEVEYITWVMINVLIATGARLSSLRSIQVRDFNYSESKIALNTTKNKIAIELPINVELSSLLMQYIARLHLEPDDYMFSTASGTQYAPRTIEDYIAKYMHNRGIVKRKVCHSFRHTFAKKYYLKTHDVYKLKEILGHQQLAMTEHYVRSLGCALFEKIEYNPQKEHATLKLEDIRQKRRRSIEFDDEPIITSNMLPF